jgi:hypothetical protein
MRNHILRLALTASVMVFLTMPTIACDKTAENTNKPVIIQSFTFTVDGDSIIPAETLQIEPGSLLTIKVEYTDPDAGDEPDPGWYSYTWVVERINVGVSIFNPNDYFIVDNENPCIWSGPDVTGFYRFIVEVRDRYGTPSQDAVIVEVNANKQPVINELSISNSSPFVNEEVTVLVDASDPDANLPLEYEWQATGGYFTSESPGEATWLSPTSGDFTITVIITDQENGSVSRTLPVIVQPNNPPVITGWDLDPVTVVMVNEQVTITIYAEDEDGDELEYSWSADNGTFNSVNGAVAVWRAPSEAITCLITCIVDDNKDGTDTADIVINVAAEE